MIKRTLARWLIGVISILITVYLAKALGLKLEWEPMWKMIIFVPVFAIISTLIGPILKLLALPITCLTLGLFSVLIGTLMFYIAGTATGAQMNFLGALFGSICFSIISAPLGALVKDDRR